MSTQQEQILHECVACGHLHQQAPSQCDCLENPGNKYRQWVATPRAALSPVAQSAVSLDTPTLRALVVSAALEIDELATLERFPGALAFQVDMARAVIKWVAQTMAQSAEAPKFLPVAARKLAELQAKGYVINGYSIMHPETRQRGLIDSSGFVGWWSNQDHGQGAEVVGKDVADRLFAVLWIYREQEQRGIASEAELLAAVRRIAAAPQPKGQAA